MLAAAAATAAACGSSGSGGSPEPSRGSTLTSGTPSRSEAAGRATRATSTPSSATTSASPAEMAGRATVPVLCYHQLRDWTSKDGEYARRLLICPPASFRAQLDGIAEDGWTTISPDQYLRHMTTGAKLPPKPVLLSFDDGSKGQVTEALPQLQQRRMTATFFVMTVVLDKPDWMASDDVKRLAGAGMTIGGHTWDHHRVDRYSATDWKPQLEESRQTLREASGQPVDHFAYPYGAWSPEAIPHVQAAGYTSAYQLSDKPLDPSAPLYTLRRILVNSTWTGADVVSQLTKAP